MSSLFIRLKLTEAGVFGQAGFSAAWLLKHPNELLPHQQAIGRSGLNGLPTPTPLRFPPDPIEELLVIFSFILREVQVDAARK